MILRNIYNLPGVGGQVDFIRGAAISTDGEGKPIIALPSTTSKGQSKIVPYLKEGGGIVTTRAHVHYIVTEYGIAYLFGRNLRQRAYSLIQIAHPDHRHVLVVIVVFYVMMLYDKLHVFFSWRSSGRRLSRLHLNASRSCHHRIKLSIPFPCVTRM